MIRFVLKAGTHADHTRRACDDCAFLAGAVNLWCTSEDARRARRTRIPGVSNCPYWQPMPHEKPPEKKGWLERLFDMGPDPFGPIVVEGLPEPPRSSGGVYGPGV